jgi:hypothetical protein
MTAGMTMELWIMVGLFVGAALIFTIGAFAFAIWHQRLMRETEQPTATHLQSVDLRKRPSGISPRTTDRPEEFINIRQGKEKGGEGEKRRK